MAAKFITDSKGRKTDAVIPYREYKKLMQDLDELEDIKLYRKAKKQKGKTIPF
jgi:hypothetical protein